MKIAGKWYNDISHSDGVLGRNYGSFGGGLRF